MPRAIWNGSVSFGLVNIPVKLYGATEDKDISFYQVHAADGGRVRYQQLFATTLLFGRIPKENRHAGLSNRRFSIVPLYDVDLPFTPEAAK